MRADHSDAMSAARRAISPGTARINGRVATSVESTVISPETAPRVRVEIR